MSSRPEWLTDQLVRKLYDAEAAWRVQNVRAPEEIAFHPDDVQPGTLTLIGYGVVRDPEVKRGTFEFRRVVRCVAHREVWEFSA